MQYQRTSVCCSAAALQNALRVFGVRVGQHKLSRLIGVTDEGADEQDLLQALHALGCTVDILESARRSDAIEWMRSRAFLGPLLLCVDDWGHWVSVAGGCKDRLWLYDPAPEPWNVAENGSWPLLPKTIAKRWKAARGHKKNGGLYYGIAVLDCDTAVARSCTSSQEA